MKVLYVDRNPNYWRDGRVRFEWTMRMGEVQCALKERFGNADLWCNLHNIDVDDFKSYDILITHLQDDPDEKVWRYNQSKDKIAEIHKRFPELKIIVYTGASEHAIDDYELKEAGANAVIRKEHPKEAEKDIEKINKCLDELL